LEHLVVFSNKNVKIFEVQQNIGTWVVVFSREIAKILQKYSKYSKILKRSRFFERNYKNIPSPTADKKTHQPNHLWG